jgi:hypothetical protein
VSLRVLAASKGCFDEREPCERRSEADVVPERLGQLDRLQRGRVRGPRAPHCQLKARLHVEGVSQVPERVGLPEVLDDPLEARPCLRIVLEGDEVRCQVDCEDAADIGSLRALPRQREGLVGVAGELAVRADEGAG